MTRTDMLLVTAYCRRPRASSPRLRAIAISSGVTAAKIVLLLPGTNSAGAQIVCRRLLEQLRTAQHPVGKVNIRATASLGLATHSVGASFASLTELVKAADVCVRAAKRAGRDRLVVHELAEQQPTAAPRI